MMRMGRGWWLMMRRKKREEEEDRGGGEGGMETEKQKTHKAMWGTILNFQSFHLKLPQTS